MVDEVAPPADDKSKPGATEGEDKSKGIKPADSDSLLPDGDGTPDKSKDKPADEKKADDKKPADEKKPDAEQPKWYFADGTPGKGDAPIWFKADKYKTVEEQAKAYPDLEKRFGAFKGAPKDGKYAMPEKLPDGVVGEFDADHPIFQKFSAWAADKQFSQDSYGELLGLFAEYEASQVPTRAEILREIGDNGESRLLAVSQWAKANLSAEEFKDLRRVMEPSQTTASTLKLIESVIAKTRGAPADRGGGDTVPSNDTEDSIRAEQGAVNPKTNKRFYDENPEYRAMIEKKWERFYAAREKKA